MLRSVFIPPPPPKKSIIYNIKIYTSHEKISIYYTLNKSLLYESKSRGVAYYVILPRQGVWGLPEAPSGVQGQSPVGGSGSKAPHKRF